MATFTMRVFRGGPEGGDFKEYRVGAGEGCGEHPYDSAGKRMRPAGAHAGGAVPARRGSARRSAEGRPIGRPTGAVASKWLN